MLVALVPLKAPGNGKSRLQRRRGAAGLDPGQRARLTLAMARDVVAALGASPVDRLVVVAAGADAGRLGRELDVEAVPEPPGAGGIDGALAAASAGLPRRASVLVVAADLPRLTAEDVRRVLAQPEDVVVAPTYDGGTGGLLRRPGGAITTCYGPRSASRHLDLARQAGIPAAVVTAPGFAHDLDTWDDLEGALQADTGPATTAVLREIVAAGS